MLVPLLGRFSGEDEVELNISLRKMMLKTVSFCADQVPGAQ